MQVVHSPAKADPKTLGISLSTVDSRLIIVEWKRLRQNLCIVSCIREVSFDQNNEFPFSDIVPL